MLETWHRTCLQTLVSKKQNRYLAYMKNCIWSGFAGLSHTFLPASRAAAWSVDEDSVSSSMESMPKKASFVLPVKAEIRTLMRTSRH